MAANFQALSPIDVYFRLNSQSGETPLTKYLGTSVTAPEFESSWYYTPVNCDLNAPSPFQLIFNGEQHHVTITLNRFDSDNWNLLRLNSSLPKNPTRSYQPGYLQLNSYDMNLILGYALPFNASGSVIGSPSFTPLVRLYYSAVLLDYRESTVGTRVQELSLLFQCNAIYAPNDSTTLFYDPDAMTGNSGSSGQASSPSLYPSYIAPPPYSTSPPTPPGNRIETTISVPITTYPNYLFFLYTENNPVVSRVITLPSAT